MRPRGRGSFTPGNFKKDATVRPSHGRPHGHRPIVRPSVRKRPRDNPDAGQDTNAAVESYHANMKSILTSSRQRLTGRRMDWLLFHLTGDVLTHYWYIVQCKLYGFITNKKAERVVVSAVLRSNDIPDHLVKLFPGGQDVAQVISVNHYPQVYTILAPGEEYAQCNCSWVDQGNICKHAVKVYKMIHPEVDDGTIIRRRGILHGTCAAGVDTTDLDSF
jgi:hypothetical protein